MNSLLDDTDRGRGSEILAVRAVEILKARLADLWTLRAPPKTASVAWPPIVITIGDTNVGSFGALSVLADGALVWVFR